MKADKEVKQNAITKRYMFLTNEQVKKETLIQIFIVGEKRFSAKGYYALTKSLARLVISLLMFKANFPEPCKRIGSG